jgi:tetratricopeptide (TPR) repeat protein
MIDEAFGLYEQIVEIAPKFIFAHYNMGYLNLIYLENFEAAKDYFEMVISLDPNYGQAFYNRGYCYELTGDLTQARKDYQHTMDIIPNFEKAIEGLNRLDKLQGIN